MTFTTLGMAITSNADKAAIDLDKLADASVRAEAGAKRLSSSSDSATAALRREASATQELAAGMQRTAVNGGYLTANLAQQAQDVVIAAQMGQNAIQVGLQQGMQAASVFQMLRSQGLSTSGAIASALGSLTSPINLVTIGLVSLSAVGIQALMGMIPQAESATDAIERHGDALSDIVKGYNSAESAVEDYIDRAGQLPRAIAIDQINREFNEITKEVDAFRQQLVQVADNGLFTTRGSEAVLTLQSLARQFSEGEITAKEFYTAVGETSSKLNILEQIGAGIPGSTQGMITAFQEGALKAIAFGSAIDQLVASSHALAGVAGGDWNQLLLNERIEGQRSAELHQIELDALNAKTPAQQRDIAMRRERLKLVDEEISEALREQKIQEAGELAFARATARAGKTATKDIDQWGNTTRDFQKRIDQVQAEIDLMGRGTFEIERQQAAIDLLNKAKDAGIPITDEVTAQINGLATDYARATAELEKLTEAYEFGKETFGSFFSDLKSNLMNGASLWDGFANAGATALDRIADKALSMAADGIWDMIFGAVMGGITGGIGGGFGSGAGRVGSFSIGGMASYDGGGFTGLGARSGGIDGKGGFPAILHPNETVVDHTRSAANQNAPSITIGSITVNANSEKEGAAAARGFAAELRRHFPAEMERYQRNPLRRTG